MFTSILPVLHHHISLYKKNLALKAFTKEVYSVTLMPVAANTVSGAIAAGITTPDFK